MDRHGLASQPPWTRSSVPVRRSPSAAASRRVIRTTAAGLLSSQVAGADAFPFQGSAQPAERPVDAVVDVLGTAPADGPRHLGGGKVLDDEELEGCTDVGGERRERVRE